MLCPYCQKEITPQGHRCPSCGGNLNVRLCPRGHVMDPAWDHCHFCPAPGEAPKDRTAFDPQRLRSNTGTVYEAPPGKTPGGAADTGTRYEPASTQGKLVGWLVSFNWDLAGQDFRVREGRNVIGRDAKACTIVISQDTRVSGVHAILIYRNGEFLLSDEKSVNGTLVNDQDISKEKCVELKNNDLVQIGDTKFKFKML